MEINIKEIYKMIKEMVKENFYLKKKILNIMEIGKMIILFMEK